MAFYEGDGFVPKTQNTNEYLELIKGMCGMLRSDQKEMVMSFAEGTRLPYDFMKEIVKLCASRVIDGSWNKTRGGSYTGSNYEAALPHAIVIEDVSDLIPFFNKIQGLGHLKITDIKALEYSIYAFNDKADHWASLAKDVSIFNGYNTDMYNMSFVFTDEAGKKTPFALNISLNRCKVGKLTRNNEKRASLLEYWFPKFDQYFHKSTNKVNEAIIRDFVNDCRTAVKERTCLVTQ